LFAGTDTVEVDARLICGAVIVGPAAILTHAVTADLVGRALLAGYAGNVTPAIRALLTNETVVGIATGGDVLAVSDTGAGIKRAGEKSLQTLAIGSSVLDDTFSIGSTGVEANIFASAIDTDTLLWTVTITIRTTAFGEAACLVWVSHLSLGASTCESCRCAGTF
jgi:hypothetical protein